MGCFQRNLYGKEIAADMAQENGLTPSGWIEHRYRDLVANKIVSVALRFNREKSARALR